MRITKVTTKTGDKGKTALADGSRVYKDSLRVHCLGSVDELNSSIGFAAVLLPEKPEIDFNIIQNDLLNIGAEISIPNSDNSFLHQDRIVHLDKEIELINKELPPLKEFILELIISFLVPAKYAKAAAATVFSRLCLKIVCSFC